MKIVVFSSVSTPVLCGFAALLWVISPCGLRGQIVQQGGFATTTGRPVVSAHYSSETPTTRIVPSGYTPTRDSEASLTEPRPLAQGPGSIATPPQFVPIQSIVPAQHAAPAVPATPARLIASESITRNYKLQHLPAPQFEQKLIGKLGKRFVPVTNVENTPNLSRFRLPVKDGTAVELSIDRQSGVTTIIGSAPMAESCLQIVRLLDVPENGGVTSTEFLPVQRANLRSVKQAATILNQETNKADTPQTPKVAQTPPAFQPNGNDAVARFGVPGAQAPPNAGATGSVVGPVKIDILDGLDTMVITGSPRDVAAIRAMLEQIETTSLEHEPVIELVPMTHADSYRISQMVQQLYAQVYQARKGSVLLLPLVKPNTILIVGKKESNDAAKELIAKLDTAVDPSSEFLVIRLKNASSDSLQTQIQQFYANRSGQGLETQVFVVSDYRTNSLVVQGSPRDLAEVAAMVLKLDTPGSDALNTVKTFPLKNAMASDLATTLQNAISGTSTGTGGFGGGGGTASTQSTRTRSPMLTMNMLDEDGNLQRASVLFDVRIVADTRSNTLIVTAPSESMPLIEALIKQLDQLPSAESQIKVFTLVNGDASTLTTMLTNLFATTSTSGTGGFGGGTSGQSSQIASVRPGIEEGESTLVSVRFQTDTRTNSIIACGTAGDMAVVEALLIRLDEENMNNRKIMVLKPVNARASDLATAIQNYATNERQLEIQNSSTYYPQSPQEQYRKEIIVISEDVTNSLIISTTPRYYEQIRQLVYELDERPKMVAIQVLIAEVRLNDSRERGMEIGLQDSLLFDRSIDGVPGFLFGDPSQGLPLGNVNAGTVGSQGITSLGVGRANGSGIGGFTFSASSESVSVLIRALEEKNRVRVLSRPHITVMHENIGSISVGQSIPYVTGTDSGNSGNMQTSTGYRDVGTILDIIPRIMPDGVIALGIHAERSSVSDSDGITIAVSDGQPITSPRINQALAETVVHARDGQTIVFAGLITDQKETTERSIPFLNKIPVIKHFFEYKSVKCERSELLIILTPTIIRNEMDVEIHRRQEASRMHWCLSDVVKLTGDSCLRTRGDDWSTHAEVPVIRAEPVILDNSQLPSEDRIQRMYPAPRLAPEGEVNNQ